MIGLLSQDSSLKIEQPKKAYELSEHELELLRK